MNEDDRLRLQQDIEEAIESASDSVHDSTLWWDTAYHRWLDTPRTIDTLINRLMESAEKYGNGRYNEGYQHGQSSMPSPGGVDMTEHAERMRQLASEITCGMDNGYGETLEMLHGLNAAAAYITCLRQVVYSNMPEVVSAARANLNRLGQEWTTHLIRHEKRLKDAQ